MGFVVESPTLSSVRAQRPRTYQHTENVMLVVSRHPQGDEASTPRPAEAPPGVSAGRGGGCDGLRGIHCVVDETGPHHG